MVHVVYEIVEHDGGWAYKVNGVFSETFRSHDEAKGAASAAAGEQQVAGKTTGIRYQSRDGGWHDEVSDGADRPETEVKG